jgi:hypothetical protein
MSVLNNQTFRHPSDAFSNTNQPLLAVAFASGNRHFGMNVQQAIGLLKTCSAQIIPFGPR